MTNQTNQTKISVSKETANVLDTMKPRLRSSIVAKLSGLSKRAITQHAANDNIPGAAKHGGVWTFDHDLILNWIREGSQCHKKKKSRKTSSSRQAASIGGSVSRSTASRTESRFAHSNARLIEIVGRDTPLPTALGIIAKECPRANLSGNVLHRRCKVHYPELSW